MKKLAKALVCRALDASVSSSGKREKLKVSKENDMTELQFWKLNLMSIEKVESCGEMAVYKGKHTGSALYGSYSVWKMETDRRDQVSFNEEKK